MTTWPDRAAVGRAVDELIDSGHISSRAFAKEVARAALTAAGSPPDNGWLPIESAPRDGRAVLGWGEVQSSNEMDQITPRGPRRAVIYWDDIDEAWSVSSHPWNGPFFEPTRWLPLAAPPTEDVP